MVEIIKYEGSARLKAFVNYLQVWVSDIDDLMEVERAEDRTIKLELDLFPFETAFINNSVNKCEDWNGRTLYLITLLKVSLEVFQKLAHVLIGLC